MIGVKLQGRLGNQMFQYAFGCVTSWRREEKFFITADSSPCQLHYFQLKEQPFIAFENALKRIRFQIGHLKPKRLYQTGSENTETIIEQSATCDILEGFFQSERYFRGYEKRVKQLFALKEEYLAAFQKKYKVFFEKHKTIAVHIRRTDYLNWDRGENFDTDASLPFSYVEQLLGTFDLSLYQVIFISDDIASVKAHFGPEENFHFESNDVSVDLQILMQADVLCLSNSSFSWWGAYLNPKPHKQVFVPQYWLGTKAVGEFPKDIICEDWNTIKR